MRTKHTKFQVSLTAAAAAILFSVLTAPAHAQWENLKDPIPRTGGGKPNLSAPAPRTADGKPDLSGVWWVPFHGEGKGVEGIPPKYLLNLAADLKPKEVPIQPWAAALVDQRTADLGKDFPISRCLPPGVPMINAIPTPFKIIQTPRLVAILYEAFGQYRQVFIDGRALSKDPNPTWMGYSIGKWEGDTLAVETAGFNDKTWLDGFGHPHTEAMHVIERFMRHDLGHMDIQITIDDPKAYTKPWTVTEGAELLPDTDLLEFVCDENEKDAKHLVGK
jgi:hypothetical protein